MKTTHKAALNATVGAVGKNRLAMAGGASGLLLTSRLIFAVLKWQKLSRIERKLDDLAA